MTPRITVQFDPEAESFDLMAESHNRTVPAGPRLFRGPPHPKISFQHPTQSAAERDARVLRDYLASLAPKISKTKGRREGA